MSSQDNEKKLIPPMDQKDGYHRIHHGDHKPIDDPHKHRRQTDQSSSSSQQRERDYRKERERMAQHGMKPHGIPSSQSSKPPTHGHHRPPVDPKLKHQMPSSRPSLPMPGHPPSANHPDTSRDNLREPPKDYNRYSRESSDPNRVSREQQQVVRDNLMKQTDANSNSNDRGLHKYPPKHDSNRRHDEVKPYIKSESDIKKQSSSGYDKNSSSGFDKNSSSGYDKNSSSGYDKNNSIGYDKNSSSGYDKNSAYQKPLNSTSQKIKSPFETDLTKSVPKQSVSQLPVNVKLEPHNGSSSNGSSYAPPMTEIKAKPEIKEEPIQVPVKKPSLFSPEKSPPKSLSPLLPITPTKKSIDSSLYNSSIPDSLSPFKSPIFGETKRHRNMSSSSEPELRPVMPKIDQVEGFENILRENTIGINSHQVPDIILPISDVKIDKQLVPISKELKPPDIIIPFNSSGAATHNSVINGIETNPTLISNLLKEAVQPTSHLPVSNSNSLPVEPAVVEKPPEPKEKEHHHKSKKKNKEKHKHKDRDRSKDEKKKKHKDKDKEKHKHKSEKEQVEAVPAQPIKITISKDKIQPPEMPLPGAGLKIKIPKERLKTDPVPDAPAPVAALKIKIPKDVIKNNNFHSGSESRKRERDRTSPSDAPSSKAQKTSYSGRASDCKQNGRSSFNKVSNYSNSNHLRNTRYNTMNINSTVPPPNLQMPNIHSTQMPNMNMGATQMPPNQMQQNYYYNYPPPTMTMNMQAPYMYPDPNMFYPNHFMYPPPNALYNAPPPAIGSGLPPPLPDEESPQPPPPPPE